VNSRWSVAVITKVGVPALAGPDRLKAVLQLWFW
jgi:hypothetical protein